jgi:hypothetical protein
MKKAIYIAICILGILSTVSCRSTASKCGLAKNTNMQQTQQNFQQTTIVAKATAM